MSPSENIYRFGKSPDSAKGFKIQCQKVAIVVELLLGDIPNR